MTHETPIGLIAGNEFGMIWTSFGLGDADSFNPSLAGYLATHTESVHYGLDNASFAIPVTNQRHDLHLLRYLQKPTVKEFFIETCSQAGVVNDLRVRFMVTGLESYNVGHNTQADREGMMHAHFSVSGALEVMTD